MPTCFDGIGLSDSGLLGRPLPLGSVGGLAFCEIGRWERCAGVEVRYSSGCDYGAVCVGQLVGLLALRCNLCADTGDGCGHVRRVCIFGSGLGALGRARVSRVGFRVPRVLAKETRQKAYRASDTFVTRMRLQYSV